MLNKQVIQGKDLINRILNYEDSEDFDIGQYEEEKYYILDWPDHCVTDQHLNDACIRGPYKKEECDEIVNLY